MPESTLGGVSGTGGYLSWGGLLQGEGSVPGGSALGGSALGGLSWGG